MNLMVVLIPFLLVSAVFSRVTIMELSVPTSTGGSAFNTPNFAIEVIVRKEGLEIANGSSVIAAIPKKDDQYDMQMLHEVLMRMKNRYPEKQDATVLMEPNIEYDYLTRHNLGVTPRYCCQDKALGAFNRANEPQKLRAI